MAGMGAGELHKEAAAVVQGVEAGTAVAQAV